MSVSPPVSPPFWMASAEITFGKLGATRDGLTGPEAQHRLQLHGPNSDDAESRSGPVRAILRRLLEPLSLILLAAGFVSVATGDAIGGSIIVAILAFSVLLDTFQEGRAVQAAETLRQSVAVSAVALRDDVFGSVPIDAVVPGNIVRVQAGDIIPADALIIESTAFTANEATLTGEPYPVDKAAVAAKGPTASEASNALFRGGVAQTGTATALVVGTGRDTLFGSAAAALATAQAPSPFERDLHAYRRRRLQQGLSETTYAATAHSVAGCSQAAWRAICSPSCDLSVLTAMPGSHARQSRIA